MPKGHRRAINQLSRGVTLLYEDRDIIVVEKPPGLLTIGSARTHTATLYYGLTAYVRKRNPRSRERIFVVHRLDREASGVLVFAKNEIAKEHLQSHWSEAEKKYLAVVHGTPRPIEDTIISYLAENSAHRVYSVSNAIHGKLSKTHYRVRKERGELSLLDVNLLTGRKHQIRVQLADRGHPIVGDSKYGFPDKSRKRLALHAKSLSLAHPSSGDRLTFSTAIPRYFVELVGAVRG